MTFTEFVETKPGEMKLIILRHDVDKKPLQSLITAEIENKLGIKGTYYFKVDKNVFHSEVIECIAELGHEIGYHYDDLNAADGVLENALDLFQKNLAKLRKLALIKTACMHGSPLSRHDNKDLWKNFDYHELGIIGEPYFDIDFNEVLYLTDTGRRWDGSKVSIRDKVIGDGLGVRGEKEDRKQKTEGSGKTEKDGRGVVGSPGGTYFHYDFNQPSELLKSSSESIPSLDVFSGYPELAKNIVMVDQLDPPTYADDWCCDPLALHLHSTDDIIQALKENHLPDKIMLTIHPQRWSDNYFFWLRELIWQKIKNPLKYLKLKSMEKNQKK